MHLGKKRKDGGFDVNSTPHVCLGKHSLACYTKIQLPDHLKNLSNAVTSLNLSIPQYPIYKFRKVYYKIWKFFKKTLNPIP